MLTPKIGEQRKHIIVSDLFENLCHNNLSSKLNKSALKTINCSHNKKREKYNWKEYMSSVSSQMSPLKKKHPRRAKISNTKNTMNTSQSPTSINNSPTNVNRF